MQIHASSACFPKETMLIVLHLTDVELEMDTPIYFMFMLSLGWVGVFCGAPCWGSLLVWFGLVLTFFLP